MHPSASQRSTALRSVLAVLTVGLAVLLLFYQYLLLHWPMLREAHFLHYIGYLINEHSFVPYHDILETSWFGTLLIHMGIGKLFGYGNTGFRLADAAFLFALGWVSWRILRHIDPWLARIGTLSALLSYIHFGPANSLQRDAVLLLPVMGALLAVLHPGQEPSRRALVVGLCFGAAATIKPHAVIGMPAILALLHVRAEKRRPVWSALLWAGLGGSIVLGTGMLWLAWRGGLGAFIDMTLHYLPLYQSFNGAHEIVTSASARWANTLHWWQHFLWVWPVSVAAAWLYGMWNTAARTLPRQLLHTLLALTVSYNIYPLIAGKFWDYHWIPYTYFAVLTTSILLARPRHDGRWQRRAAWPALLVFLYAMGNQYLPGRALSYQLQQYPNITMEQPFDDHVANYIRGKLGPGDRIQVIDQGGPSTIYLLKAEAVLATPYLGSFMFLHHTDQPYVQRAQQHFIQLLEQNPPAMFLVMTDFTRPSGPGTITAIPGLQDYLEAYYRKDWQEPGFTFWIRKD